MILLIDSSTRMVPIAMVRRGREHGISLAAPDARRMGGSTYPSIRMRSRAGRATASVSLLGNGLGTAIETGARVEA